MINSSRQTITLYLDQPLYIDNGLCLRLQSFSHKRPYVGGPTKVSVDIALAQEEISALVTLAIQGIEGQTEQQDGISENERYGKIEWQGFSIQLTGINYGQSIDLLIEA